MILALTGAAIGLVLGWLVIRQVEWAQVGEELLDYPPALFVAGLVIILASTYFRALRWRVLYVDPRVRTVRLFLIENAAVGLNNVSPVRVLSEPVQVGLLTLRDRLSAGEVVATLGITRLLDLAVTVVALGTALVLVPAFRPFAPLLVLATVASAVGIGLLFAATLGSSRLPMIKRLPLATDAKAAIEALRRRPGRVLLSLGITLLHWGFVCLCAWVVSWGTEFRLDAAESIAVTLGALFFATSVPGLPVAFGTFEFAILALMEGLAVDAETALTFALLLRVLLFVPQMVFAAVLLPREGVGSLNAIRMLRERWVAHE
ncbi:MAG: lysylphosphatidylglycerol synthase transmembrane domain-containing protein [Dehalococcoidia bacterium]